MDWYFYGGRSGVVSLMGGCGVYMFWNFGRGWLGVFGVFIWWGGGDCVFVCLFVFFIF